MRSRHIPWSWISVGGAIVVVVAVAALANTIAMGGDGEATDPATRLALARRESETGESDAAFVSESSAIDEQPAGPATEAQLGVERRELAALSPEAAAFLAGREPQWGVAVLLPERGALYESNGDEPFPLASVAKVLAMLTLMDQALDEGRELEDWEHDLLWYAITESDNAAMDWLWDEIGGGEAVGAFVREAGVRDIRVGDDTYSWGDVAATPVAMAQLLGKLAAGELLDEGLRANALALMTQVAEGQRWGASAAFADDGTVALKDGWYPALTGWRVTSVAMTTTGETAIVVVFTRNQATQEDGMATIEGVGRRVGAAIAGADPVATDVPEGAAATERVVFVPSAEGLAVVEGTCAEGSRVVGRPDAWQCLVDEAALDPCFEVEGVDGLLVCGVLPDGGGEGVAVRLAEALPEARPAGPAQPWFLELADGVTCVRTRSAPLNEDGDRVTYECSDGGAIIGPLQQTNVIWALRTDEWLWETWNAAVVRAWY